MVARELAAKGTHLVVDTLGLTLDDAVRQQLSCIAEATGGTYTAVQDADQLADRIGQLVRRADVPVENPAAVEGATQCADAPLLGAGVYIDRAEFGEPRWYRVPVRPGQELRASVSVAADRAMDPDHGVLLRAVSEEGQELTRGTGAGHGRTDVMSTGLRYPLPEPEEGDTSASVPVCLEVSNSFSVPEGQPRTPGLPVELAVDVVAGPDNPSDVAAFGLARGWVPLVLLTVVGLVAGVLWGLLVRMGIALGRAH